MKKALRIILYSVIIWALGFIAGLILWPLHDSQFMLFKSLINVAGIIIGIVFLALYFNKISVNYISEGVAFGVAWFVINIGLDLIVLVGILKTPFIDYIISPGIIYLNMPVMSIGIGYILSKKK